MADKRLRKPDWLRVRIPAEIRGEEDRVAGTLSRFHLNTVCHEALCPNRGECFQRQTATFMILGAVCSRNCAFCNVNPGKPGPLDPQGAGKCGPGGGGTESAPCGGDLGHPGTNLSDGVRSTSP